MAKMYITIYTCDLCKKKSSVKNVTLPCLIKSYDPQYFYPNDFNSYEKVDMCPECEKKYVEVVKKYFGTLMLDKTTNNILSFEQAIEI